MSPEERPRERLRHYGGAALSDSELIAIILSTGVRGESATSVAHRLIATHRGLKGLMQLESIELEREHGLGEAKAAKLKAALELGKRVSTLGGDERPSVSSPEDIVRLVGVEMAVLDREQLKVLILDTKNHVIANRTVYQGSANEATVRVGELFRDAVRHNAVAIALVHNHPSGDPTPSAADIELTSAVVGAGALLDIKVLDHVIIGLDRHVSLRRLGLGFDPARRGS